MNSSLNFYFPVVTAVVVVAVGILLCISVPMLVIFVQCVRKQKSKSKILQYCMRILEYVPTPCVS